MAQQQTKTIYTCPMHPQVQKEKPGNCPICGMTLVKKKITVAPSSKPEKKQPLTQYAPPSKKQIKSDTMTRAVPAMDAMHEEHDTSAARVFSGKVIMTPGRTVRYDLYVTDTTVNFTGRERHAYAINGSLPGPDLVFTEGDTAAVYVHNQTKEMTSIHWHGVILPNQFDGVPYLTTQPIKPGGTHLYKFAVHQNGTYWYHSHAHLQEQIGIYGALIFRKREGQDMMVMQNNEGQDMKSMKMDSMKNMHGEHVMPNSDTSTMKDHQVHNMDERMNNHNIPGMDMGNHMQISAMPPAGDGSYNAEQTVVLSEWTDEKPEQVQRRLRTANDWYAIKKGSTQSYSEAIAQGYFKTKLVNEWKRMNAMDVSDVYYDRFLTNGQPVQEAPQYKKGDRVRLRIVNAGASSYFWVQYGGGKMTVIANDGNDVKPIEVDRLIIGVSETYDVVVTIPENMSYEFRATPEDRTKAASLWLGSGMKMPAPQLPRLKYFEGMKMMNDMMKMNGDMAPMDMKMSLQQMDMNSVMYDEVMNPSSHDHAEQMDTRDAANMIEMQGMNAGSGSQITTLNYAMLESPEKTMLPDAPYKELHFELTGNMRRYVWSMNNKILREWDKIRIEKGQNVRIIMYNNSMMRHPMHLHGHDFRVLNGQGEYAPLKNVLDIMPMETDTIEFTGSQTGDWFFHCHILYHMMAGMGNVFHYNPADPNPEVSNDVKNYNKFVRMHKIFHFMAEVGLESNGSDGRLVFPGNRYELRTEWRLGIKPEYGQESETYFGRYFGKQQWWFPFIGFDYHHNSRMNENEKNTFGQLSNQNNRKAFFAGVDYLLPMLITVQARVDTKGKFRMQVSRDDIPLTPRLRMNAVWNTDKEYTAGLRYILRKWLSLSAHYDSDMKFGAGIAVIY
ncbi:MAG: multicopper oxidase domain-containing protein [Flavisolibacter sp.]